MSPIAKAWLAIAALMQTVNLQCIQQPGCFKDPILSTKNLDDALISKSGTSFSFDPCSFINVSSSVVHNAQCCDLCDAANPFVTYSLSYTWCDDPACLTPSVQQTPSLINTNDDTRASNCRILIPMASVINQYLRMQFVSPNPATIETCYFATNHKTQWVKKVTDCSERAYPSSSVTDFIVDASANILYAPTIAVSRTQPTQFKLNLTKLISSASIPTCHIATINSISVNDSVVCNSPPCTGSVINLQAPDLGYHSFEFLPDKCSSCNSSGSPNIVKVGWVIKMDPANLLTSLTGVSPTYTADFFVFEILLDGEAPMSFSSDTTQINLLDPSITFFRTNFDNTGWNALWKSTLKYSFSCQWLETWTSPIADPCASAFTWDQTSKVTVKEYERVSGMYKLTFTASHPQVPGYSVSQSPQIQVVSRCAEDSPLIELTQADGWLQFDGVNYQPDMVIPAKTFQSVDLAKITVSSIACQSMNLGAQFKIWWTGIIYDGDPIINGNPYSETASSYVNEVRSYPTRYTYVNPTYNFDTATSLGIKYKVLYNTNDPNLISWTSQEFTFTVKVFKIIKVADETYSAILGGTPLLPFLPSVVTEFPASQDIIYTGKIKTNMEDDPAYNSTNLALSFACTMKEGSNVGNSDTCCGMFQFAGRTLSFETGLGSIAKDYNSQCDGLYEIKVFAKHATKFPNYIREYVMNFDFKYDCAFLVAQGFYSAPASSLMSPTGTLLADPLPVTVRSSDLLVVCPKLKVKTEPDHTYSCSIQYKLSAPNDDPFFGEAYEQGILENSLWQSFPYQTQLKIKLATHAVMELREIKAEAFILSTDTIASVAYPGPYNPEYTGEPYVKRITWTHTIDPTKDCTTISPVEKADDPDATASSKIMAQIIVNETNNTRLINFVDYVDKWDSKWCLSEIKMISFSSPQTNIDGIFSFPVVYDSTTRSTIKLSAVNNLVVNNLQAGASYCQLSVLRSSTTPYTYQRTKYCDFVIQGKAYKLTGSTYTLLGVYSTFTVRVLNECNNLDFTNYWTASPTPLPYTYEIWHSASPVQLTLPSFSPSLKGDYSSSPYNTSSDPWSVSKECGNTVSYSLQADTFVTLISATLPIVEVFSQEPALSGTSNSTDFKRLYEIDIEAEQLEFPGQKFSYKKTKGANQPKLEIAMRDRCMGMYFSMPQISANFTGLDLVRTVTKFTLNEDSRVYYHLAAPTDYFLVERIFPYQYTARGEALMHIDGRCGTTLYTPNTEPWIGYDLTQINKLNPTDEGMVFSLKQYNKLLLIDYDLKIQLNSNLSDLYPKSEIVIKVTLQPCLVEAVRNPNLKEQDFTVIIGGPEVTLRFMDFEQEPKCNYVWTYELTILEVDERNPHIDFDGLVRKNPDIVGTSPYKLGTLVNQKAKFKSILKQTEKKTFAAFITGKLAVSKYQQLVKISYEAVRFLVVPVCCKVIENTPPEIFNVKEKFEIFALETQELKVGQLTDYESPYDIKLVRAEINCLHKVSWIKVPDLNVALSEIVVNVKVPQDVEDDVCTITFVAEDTSLEKVMRVTQVIEIKVNAQKFQNVMIKDDKPARLPQTANSPMIMASSVNQAGLLKIKFNREILIPSLFANLTSENEGPEYFNMRLIIHEENLKAQEQFEDIPDQGRMLIASNPNEFKWTIVKAKDSREMNFDLQFSVPMIISRYGADNMEITMTDKAQITSSDSQSAAFFEPLIVKLPMQIENPVEAAVVSAITEALSKSMTLFFTSNMVITVFSSIVIYFLWAMINGLQVIALTCLFKIRLPANVMTFNVEILKLAAFDLFQTTWLLQSVFGFSETPSFSSVFEQASYEGSVFIIGLGMMFLVMVAYGAFLLVRIYILRNYSTEQRFKCNTKIVPWLWQHNVESAIIRFALEGNIDILFWALITLINVKISGSLGKKFSDGLSNILSCLMLVFSIYAPFHAAYRAWQISEMRASEKPPSEANPKNLDQFEIPENPDEPEERKQPESKDQESKQPEPKDREEKEVEPKEPEPQKAENKNESDSKIKELFEDFKMDLPSLLFYLIFIVRRMIMVLTLVFLTEYSNLQILVYLVSAIVMLVYVTHFKPYENEAQNTQEIVNELFILLSAYFVLVFSDWIPVTAVLPRTDKNLKSEVGKIMLGLLCLYIVSNLSIIAYHAAVAFKLWLKQRKMIKLALQAQELKASIKRKQQEAERIAEQKHYEFVCWRAQERLRQMQKFEDIEELIRCGQYHLYDDLDDPQKPAHVIEEQKQKRQIEIAQMEIVDEKMRQRANGNYSPIDFYPPVKYEIKPAVELSPQEDGIFVITSKPMQQARPGVPAKADRNQHHSRNTSSKPLLATNDHSLTYMDQDLDASREDSKSALFNTVKRNIMKISDKVDENVDRVHQKFLSERRVTNQLVVEAPLPIINQPNEEECKVILKNFNDAVKGKLQPQNPFDEIRRRLHKMKEICEEDVDFLKN